MRGLAVAALCVVLAGCESETEKLERLRTEAALTNLGALAIEQELQRLPYNTPGAVRDSLTRALEAARNEALLAQRDLDRFLR